MPWASAKQRAKFYATPSLRKFIPEFNGEPMRPPIPHPFGSKTLGPDVTRRLRAKQVAPATRRPAVFDDGKMPRPMSPGARKALVKQVRGL